MSRQPKEASTTKFDQRAVVTRRPSAAWWKYAIWFCLGGALPTYVFLTIETNRPAAAPTVEAATAAKATPLVEKSDEQEPSTSAKELSREELDRYVQWAQQMNATTRGMASGQLPFQSGPLAGGASAGGGAPTRPQIPGSFGPGFPAAGP